MRGFRLDGLLHKGEHASTKALALFLLHRSFPGLIRCGPISLLPLLLLSILSLFPFALILLRLVFQSLFLGLLNGPLFLSLLENRCRPCVLGQDFGEPFKLGLLFSSCLHSLFD